MGASWSSLKSSNGAVDEEQSLEAYVASETSLKDHLVNQLNLALTDPVDRLIGAQSWSRRTAGFSTRGSLASLVNRAELVKS